MSKVKFLTILSLALVIINIVWVGFFLLRPHHKKHQNAPKAYIIKQLNLDKEQVTQYDVLIEKHQKERNALHKKILELRERLYLAALKEDNAFDKKQILVLLKAVHQDLEIVHLEHFEQIKKICRTNQMELFDALVDELAHVFAAKGSKRMIK